MSQTNCPRYKPRTSNRNCIHYSSGKCTGYTGSTCYGLNNGTCPEKPMEDPFADMYKGGKR